MSRPLYFDQVDLLLSILEDSLEDPCLALKGGTAINLFVFDMPRLSVDIDLVYVPVEDRKTSLTSMQRAFERMKQRFEHNGLDAQLKYASDHQPKQIVVRRGNAVVKIEINPVLRGTVHLPQRAILCDKAQAEFRKFSEVNIVHPYDLFAGKLCAALDRQHPRDLFDMHQYLTHFSYTAALHQTFLVYLLSSNRPISELLRPNFQLLKEAYTKEFVGMTEEIVACEVLEETFHHLVDLTLSTMTDTDKAFLLSFKQGAPQWNLLPFAHVQSLPALRWKLYNISQMTKSQHLKALRELEYKLGS
jgi:predicted nucleotidyltransferase component of viral defense system